MKLLSDYNKLIVRFDYLIVRKYKNFNIITFKFYLKPINSLEN